MVAAIVDDDEGFRRYLSAFLELGGLEVVEFASGEDFLRASVVPDVAILDVKLPGMSGFELCRILRHRLGQQLPIVFVSGERRDAYDKVAGLLMGADDYLVKPILGDELMARLHRLRERGGPAGEVAGTGNGHPALTNREHEVLQLLALGNTQRQIANELFISPHTVATHIQRVLEKLGAHSRAEAVARAHMLGLVDTKPGPEGQA